MNAFLTPHFMTPEKQEKKRADIVSTKKSALSASLRVIVITGSPGTGKSTLAKILAKKFHWQRLDLHKYYKQISEQYDLKKKCYVINKRKFETLVRKKMQQADKRLIIDSHIAHLLPKSLVELCIVLTCSNIKELEKRLQKRKYSAEKIRENVDAEIFQVCLMEAREKGHKVVVFDGCKSSPNIITKRLRKFLKVV